MSTAMFSSLVLILSAVALTLSMKPEMDKMWLTYKKTYGKAYSMNVDFLRKGIWKANLNYIQRHNLEADRGKHSYRMGENEFTDMTNAEFRSRMNGYRVSNVSSSTDHLFVSTLSTISTSVDWRTQGYVTDIKDQRECGACWAFSATGSLEGQHFKKTGKLVSLSEQNLLDCTRRYGNKGCEGGLMDNAFRYIVENKGIDTERSYPYLARTDFSCHFKKSDVGATMSSHVVVKRGSEQALAEAVAEVGPISVAMDAGHESFQHYKTGVYSEKSCSPEQLDHGVLVVGYGSVDGQNYWIVKNSWGTSWGEEGYFRIAKDNNNMCGLASQASYPVV